jgi:hypothetical protein
VACRQAPVDRAVEIGAASAGTRRHAVNSGRIAAIHMEKRSRHFIAEGLKFTGTALLTPNRRPPCRL